MAGLFADDHRGPPLAGHSLSWRDNRKTQLGPNKTLFAKIWTPENPSDFKLSEHIESEREMTQSIGSTIGI